MRTTSTFQIARRAAAALVVAGAVAGFAGSGTAAAATVNVGPIGGFNSLVYLADPGENNKLEVTKLSFGMVRVDDVYAIDLTADAAEQCEHPFLLDGTVVDCVVVGDRWLDLGDGNDTVAPGEGTDLVLGGPGFDRVTYAERTDPITVTLGDGGNDGEAGEHDTVANGVEGVTGGAGNDTIVDLDGYANAFDGGPGDDTIKGGEGWDATLVGGEGDDTIEGGNGHDMLFGGADEDSLKGGADNDQLLGEAGQDTLVGGLGADSLSGGVDFDIVSYFAYSGGVTVDIDNEADDGGRREHDNVGKDVEQVNGGSGPDTLIGNAAAQLLIGGLGADTIDGGGGVDILYGNEHGDTLLSDDGVKDSVYCGTGIDGIDGDALDNAVDCETRG